MRHTSALRLLVAALPCVLSCDVRHHLIGEWDGGFGPSRTPDAGGAADAGTGGGSDGAAGGGSGGSTPDGGTAPDAALAVPIVALPISAREAVTRVARVLWQAPPDATLQAMADSGAIATDADLRRVARTMLDDPRARVGVGGFYRWWLQLDRAASADKDPVLFPGFSAALGALMAQETETFGVTVTLDDGRFATLMSAPYSFINETLAATYGVTGVAGAELRKVDLDAATRAGIFTQPAAQLVWSSPQRTNPSRRGSLIQNKMLCANVPEPPPEVNTVVPPPSTEIKSDRQRLLEGTSEPSCVPCHKVLDPVGFAYDVFDPVGRVRDVDSVGQPIDATGQLVVGTSTYAVDGPVSVAKLLSELDVARRCMGSQWLEYMLGRVVTDVDAGSVELIHRAFALSGHDLRALIAAAAASPSFVAPTGGTACTPGANQTCNDDPRISSLHGTCTASGRCVCGANYLLNPMTGRCL